jgi:diacylglycerol kinase family enzyme
MSPPLAADPAASTPAAAPCLRRVAAVINPASGSVRPGAEADLRALVAEHGCRLDVYVIDGGVEAPVRKAVDAAPDLVIVLAGDGTARMAADLCGPDGPLLAPLAGGTMNMLPHALYGPASWREALQAVLQDGVERAVSGGRICEHSFYVAAIIGAAALWAPAREALRSGRLLAAGKRVNIAFRRAFAGGLRYGGEDRGERVGEALMLICPLVSKALDQEHALELAALDVRDAREVVRLAFNGLGGGWRNDPAVSVELVQRGWAAMRGSIPAVLDGEAQKLPRRVEFEFTPRAFRALVPKAPTGATAAAASGR